MWTQFSFLEIWRIATRLHDVILKTRIFKKKIISKCAEFNEQYSHSLLNSGRIIRIFEKTYSEYYAIAVTCCIIEPLLEEERLGFLLSA